MTLSCQTESGDLGSAALLCGNTTVSRGAVTREESHSVCSAASSVPTVGIFCLHGRF
jgi:hypothetical protein